MNRALPDINRFERIVFRRRDTLSQLISFSLKVLEPRHIGLLYGTDQTNTKYLAPEKWDRGMMHKFSGIGASGLMLKLFGRWIVQYKGLSPIRLYQETFRDGKKEEEGIIPYILRKHAEFYGHGVKVLIIDTSKVLLESLETSFSSVSIQAYNGSRFKSIQDLKVNNAIVRQFKAQNFVSAYVPDYGAIVFNTVSEQLLKFENGRIKDEDKLKNRLDLLIAAIEMASLAHVGRAKGRQAAKIIWHKEKKLRRTAFELQQRQVELEAQRQYLRAVGAVNEEQLNMEAIDIPDGVYAFMDMVGSARIRRHFIPKDYFFILNLCHQIAADNATTFACRVDNFIGDCVFLQNASPFDSKNRPRAFNLDERMMLLMFALSSSINQIHLLKQAEHPMDSDGLVNKLVRRAGCEIGFRAGLEIGPAMVGPLGSKKRKIVTAIGKSVNNASRLESSGRENRIHISKTVMEILDNACISKDTQLIRKILSTRIHMEKSKQSQTIRFWDAYQSYFNLTSPVFVEQKNITYKEYSSDRTYLVQCIEDVSS